jgi:hypothetical protein
LKQLAAIQLGFSPAQVERAVQEGKLIEVNPVIEVSP